MSRDLIGPGLFVAVVGPSGAGKDSLIAYARQHLAGRPGIVFARRVVTRPSDPGSESHDTLDEAAFADAEAAGAFALSWRSHGLAYGIPAGVDDAVRAGAAVVANVSRGVVGDIRMRYAAVLPVLVTVSADALAARLAARGRETEEEIGRRMARNADYAGFEAGGCRVLDNSGPLENAGAELLRILDEAARGTAAAGA